MSGYMKMLSGKTNCAYLSPKEMECLKDSKYNCDHNAHKSDTFAVGMVLLEAAS